MGPIFSCVPPPRNKIIYCTTKLITLAGYSQCFHKNQINTEKVVSKQKGVKLSNVKNYIDKKPSILISQRPSVYPLIYLSRISP